MLKKNILFLLIFAFSNVFGEGWTKKQGTGYYALDFRFLSASKYHDSNGENIEIEGVSDIAFNLYSEYGITDNLTLRLNFPFYKILKNDDAGADNDNSGIGDIDFGLRYKLGQFGKTAFSAGINFGIPISTEDVYGKRELALSDGEFNQILSLEAGHSLYPLPAYISGSVKFNNRNEGYSDQFYIGAEGGYKFHKDFLLNLRFNFLKSLNKGNLEVLDNILPIQANNQEYLALRLGAFINFYRNYGIALTSDFGLYAKNVLSAPVFSVGFYIK